MAKLMLADALGTLLCVVFLQAPKAWFVNVLSSAARAHQIPSEARKGEGGIVARTWSTAYLQLRVEVLGLRD